MKDLHIHYILHTKVLLPLVLVYWYWCTGTGVLVLVYWYWCTGTGTEYEGNRVLLVLPVVHVRSTFGTCTNYESEGPSDDEQAITKRQENKRD